MRVVERSFSDLLRRPNEVAADLDTADVLVRRRDESDLFLTLADRNAGRNDAFRMLAVSFRNLALRSPRVLEDALVESFAWVEFLPLKDRRVFLDEFSRLLLASAELDTFDHVTQLLLEWRATAEVHAEPRLASRLRRPVSATGGAVPLPPKG